MTPQEFKAWFDGYTEAIGDAMPSEKQWQRIKERVGEINGIVTPYPAFIDRYWPKWAYWNGQSVTDAAPPMQTWQEAGRLDARTDR